MGATSLGWCLLTVANNEPNSIACMGVRIFPDGRDAKSREPMAVTRRAARGARRRRDRTQKRQRVLMDFLIKNGFMPDDAKERKKIEKYDPYELRARALDGQVSLYELGRTFFHLSQRRGFKSNRISDRGNDEKGAINTGIENLQEKMSGFRTLGEYLFHSEQKRARPHTEKGKNSYVFYPDRSMYLDEIQQILKKQKQFHSELTEDTCQCLINIIFYQRPLKAPKIGLCTFETQNKESRARLAYSEVQNYRIWQEVNNLDLKRYAEDDPMLTNEDRQKIAKALQNKKDMSFAGIRKLLNFSRDMVFNLESNKRKKLLGNDTQFYLQQEECFGVEWQKLSDDKKNEIIDLLMEEDDEAEIISALTGKYGLTQEQAVKTADIPLKDGYGRLSIKAIRKILPYLQQGEIYSKACELAGYHHSQRETGEIFDRLPYYGEVLEDAVIGGSFDPEDRKTPEKYFGKINNPTVHIALNQLQKLVNEIIATYGHPDSIHVELARDLKCGQKQLKEINLRQAKETKDNERITAELIKLNVKQNYANRMIYKLWEDLSADPAKRCCPFTGKQIAVHKLFSGDFEVEHLLPFSRSYNDSRANKVLACKTANRRKAGRSPFDAFGQSPEWNDILARVENLPEDKKWRFQENAWEIAKGEGEDLIARQLSDTQYMSRISKRYLSKVCDPRRVVGIPGQLTAMLRRKWGLNDLLSDGDLKDRTDHRHHAIDAFVVGCTTRSLLQRISAEARRFYDDSDLYERRLKLVASMPDAFPDFYEQLGQNLDNIVVSYKPDHGNAYKAQKNGKTTGKLHEDTAYGFVKESDKKGKAIYVVRKPIDSFKDQKGVKAIVDDTIRNKLLEATSGMNGVAFIDAVQAYARKNNHRRFRIHVEKSKNAMIGISRAGKEVQHTTPYKYYATGGNYCAEIYCSDKGPKAGKWQCEIISTYDAHKPGVMSEWRKNHPTAKLIMRLQIDDMVAYEDGDETKICRVKKMTGGLVYLRNHKIAKEDGDQFSWAASPNLMQQSNARKVSVDILGRVRDPAGRIAYKKSGVAVA